MHSITIGRFSISILEPAGRQGPGLRQQLALWLRTHRTAEEFARADPRIVADVGAPPRAGDPAMAAFGVDPAPLWGIGLTPRPRADGRR